MAFAPGVVIHDLTSSRPIRDAVGDPEAIDLLVNPHRPGRAEPRVRKRRPKQYPLMNKPRHELRQALYSTRLAA